MPNPVNLKELEEHLPTIRTENWRRLLNCVPGVVGEDRSSYTREVDDLTALNSEEREEMITSFVDLCYDMGLVIDFDWMHWKEGPTYVENNSEKVAEADLETVIRLVTAHIRNDRFSEGWLESLLDNGHLVILLRRLKCLLGM